MCIAGHRTSAEVRIRSICHGVRPPLTAKTKRRRAATARFASSAMIEAALAATKSGVSRISTSIFPIMINVIIAKSAALQTTAAHYSRSLRERLGRAHAPICSAHWRARWLSNVQYQFPILPRRMDIQTRVGSDWNSPIFAGLSASKIAELKKTEMSDKGESVKADSKKIRRSRRSRWPEGWVSGALGLYGEDFAIPGASQEEKGLRGGQKRPVTF